MSNKLIRDLLAQNLTKMKKILFNFLSFFIMTLCFTSFTACSEDDGEKTASNPLVGTWEEVFRIDSESTTTTTFTFNSNGTGSKTIRLDVVGSPGLTQDPEYFSYTYNAETEAFRIKFDDDATLYNGTASLTGNTLVLRYGDTYYSLKRK